MLKPADLRAMAPEQRTQLFDRLATAWYETDRHKTTLAGDFDVTIPTVHRWRNQHNVPWAVIFTLDRWLNSPAKAEAIMLEWQDMPAQLSDAADKLANVARTMARVARLSAASAGPSPS